MRGSILIIIATLIWGIGAAAQYGGMEHTGPFTFNVARFFVDTLVVLPPAIYFIRKEGITKSTFIAGIVCGTTLAIAINLQQFGYSLGLPAGRVGFITSLYVIIVPVISIFILRKKPGVFVWIGASISLVGLYFLSMAGEMYMGLGDLLILACAFVFAVQILVVGHFSPRQNVFALACVQYITVAILSLIFAFIFETPSMSDLVDGAPFVLYTGVLSSGVAYLLQMKAQKTTAPTIAAVIFSFEGVVSASAGWLLLNQFLTPLQILGCVLIFAATIITQFKGETV